MLPHKCVHFDHPVQWGNHLKLACQHSESTLYIRQDCDPTTIVKIISDGFWQQRATKGATPETGPDPDGQPAASRRPSLEGLPHPMQVF